MKSVAILTTFRSADEAYSLNRVVIDQIKMLTMGGYGVKVVVAKGFVPSGWYAHPGVECVAVSDVPVSNVIEVDPTFEADVDLLSSELYDILKDVETCFTHDLVYQPAAVKHNVAARKMIADHPEMRIKFIHWIHSATQPSIVSGLRNGNAIHNQLLSQKFPRSFYITFNEYSTPRIAKWFNIEESDVKYIPHPHDFYQYKDPMTVEIASKLNLLSKDIVCMYPCRLDRGKQPEKAIKVIYQAKQLGRSVCMIVADFHSTGGDKVKYRQEMKDMGVALGMTETELVFLSDLMGDSGGQYELPHRVIQELFEFTNVFILPSRSETYSLVAQEAAAKRNFLVLNQDFPPFRSIYGEAPLYRQFSSNIDSQSGMDGETNTNYNDEVSYYKDIANYICYVQEHTRVLALFNKIRKERNLKYVFQHNIEPLFSAEPGKYNY